MVRCLVYSEVWRDSAGFPCSPSLVEDLSVFGALSCYSEVWRDSIGFPCSPSLVEDLSVCGVLSCLF